MNTFGQNLKRMRKEVAVSQHKLANSIGVTQQCVSDWEKDKIEPTMSNLCKLADFFDVTIDYLVGRTDY